MQLKDKTYYRQMVETVLRAAGFSEPPVSIHGVAAHLGVPIREYPMPVWFGAALIYEDGMPAILLNSQRPAQAQRDGLAHVLAHILMVMNDPAEHYPRDTQMTHQTADQVGAELQMPAYMVRDQAQKWFNDYRYLAGLFGVTEVQMFEAMKDLGLIKSKGVLWEY